MGNGGEFREPRELDQVHIVLGFPCAGYGDPDYYPTLLLSTLLGGLDSAGITVTMQYSDLNQPQSIVAPTTVAPYSQFTTKIQQILQVIESAVGSQLPTGTGTTVPAS